MELNPIGMYKSENINGLNIYLSGIRVGADALILNTVNGNMFLGTVAKIDDFFDQCEEMPCGFDFYLPFFTDDADYYVGINVKPECMDTLCVQKCIRYIRLPEKVEEKDPECVRRETERERHKMHREIKKRMYAERIARKKRRTTV